MCIMSGAACLFGYRGLHVHMLNNKVMMRVNEEASQSRERTGPKTNRSSSTMSMETNHVKRDQQRRPTMKATEYDQQRRRRGQSRPRERWSRRKTNHREGGVRLTDGDTAIWG